MSNARAVQEQISRVVAESGLDYRSDDEVIEVLAPPLEGHNRSTTVRVRSKDWNDQNVVVLMSALVLKELPTDDAEILTKGHIICNRMNQDQIFGRWVYYPEEGTIFVENELVGESIGEAELLRTLNTLSVAADRWDESIQEELGAGVRLLQESL